MLEEKYFFPSVLPLSFKSHEKRKNKNVCNKKRVEKKCFFLVIYANSVKEKRLKKEKKRRHINRKNERCENNHPVHYGTTNGRVAAAAAAADAAAVAETAAAGGTGGAYATDRGVRSNRFPARPVPRLGNHLLACARVLGSDHRGIV